MKIIFDNNQINIKISQSIIDTDITIKLKINHKTYNYYGISSTSHLLINNKNYVFLGFKIFLYEIIHKTNYKYITMFSVNENSRSIVKNHFIRGVYLTSKILDTKIYTFIYLIFIYIKYFKYININKYYNFTHISSKKKFNCCDYYKIYSFI
jgi:hypothetical protein